MSEEKDFGPIYGRTLSQCPPYVQGGLWQGIDVPADIRRPPPDPAALLADLRARYADAVLLESGVATIEPEGVIHLDPALCDANTAIIALRKASEQAPYNLLANRGGIAHGELPLCASLEDDQIATMLQAKVPVLQAR